LNLLVFNWHEPFLHNLSKLGHQLHIVEPQAVSLNRIDGNYAWQTCYRPFPPNASDIRDLDSLRGVFLESKIDLAICLTYFDLALFKHFPAPKIYYPITPFRGGFEEMSPIEKQDAECYVSHLLENVFLAYSSQGMRQKDLGTSDKQHYLFNASNGVDLEDYHSYDGEIPAVLRVGNRIQIRRTLNYPLQTQVLEGIPHLVLGTNPGMPNARLSKDWDDLRMVLRKHRLFLSLYTPDFDLETVEMSQLEAMATGMPIVGTPHPGCLIEDGKNGFVSSDPEILREKIMLLLKDRDLAVRLGENARQTVAEKYGFEKYRKEWNQVLETVVSTRKGSKPSSQPKEKLVIQWEGPLTTGDAFGESNRKTIQSLHQQGAFVIPSPKNEQIVVEHLMANHFEGVKTLEVLGRGLSSPIRPSIRILSPFFQDSQVSEQNNIAKTFAYFYCEQGSLPTRWVEHVKQDRIREVWVSSNMEKRFYEAEGIPGERLAVVPRGVESSDSALDIALELEGKFALLYAGTTYSHDGGGHRASGLPERVPIRGKDRFLVLFDRGVKGTARKA